MAGYDWDEEVQTSDSSFHSFVEGDYDFKVVDFERGRVKSGKNAGANQAIYTFRITDGAGHSSEEKYFIPLVESLTWKATKFFKSIGAIPVNQPSGEKVRFPWGEVVGMAGRCHVKPRTWTGDDGVERTGNDVTECLLPGEATPAKAQAADYGDL